MNNHSRGRSSCKCSSAPCKFIIAMYSKVKNNPNKGATSSVTMDRVVSNVGRNGSSSATAGVIVGTVEQTGLTVVRTNGVAPTLGNVNSAYAILLVDRRSTVITRMNSDQICRLHKGGGIFHAFSRSVIFSLIGRGMVARRRTELSTRSGMVAQTLKVGSSVRISIARLPCSANSEFLLAASNVRKSISRVRLVRVMSSGGRTLNVIASRVTAAVSNGKHGRNKNRSGLAVTVVRAGVGSGLESGVGAGLGFALVNLVTVYVIDVTFGIVLYSQGTSASANIRLARGVGDKASSLGVIRLESDAGGLLSRLRTFSSGRASGSARVGRLSSGVRGIRGSLHSTGGRLGGTGTGGGLCLSRVRQLVGRVSCTIGGGHPTGRVGVGGRCERGG